MVLLNDSDGFVSTLLSSTCSLVCVCSATTCGLTCASEASDCCAATWFSSTCSLGSGRTASSSLSPFSGVSAISFFWASSSACQNALNPAANMLVAAHVSRPASTHAHGWRTRLFSFQRACWWRVRCLRHTHDASFVLHSLESYPSQSL